MARYWRIFRTFFVSSFARELEFRANFLAKVAQNIVWTFFFLMILMVIYRNTDEVAGWGRGDALVLAATCFLMTALNSALFMSLHEIPEQVRMGTLDFVLTKPLDSQFWVSVRKFNFSQIGTLLAGTVFVIAGIVIAKSSPGVDQWLAYLWLLGCSITIYYSLNLFLMTLGIFWVRVDNLWVLGETVMEVARYPLEIYTLALQRFFIYAVPLAFLAFIPARQLVRGFDLTLTGLGTVWALAMFFGARAFWNYATQHYSSASS